MEGLGPCNPIPFIILALNHPFLLGHPHPSSPHADKFGVSPLLEALRSGHTDTAHLLRAHGGLILLDCPANELCHAVKRGSSEYLKVRRAGSQA